MANIGDQFIAIGTFASAGGHLASNIASWDGHDWTEIGGGLTPTSRAALTCVAYNGDIIVGGSFFGAGGLNVRGIARWDGSQWHALGGDVHGPGTQGGVFATQVFNGELIAAGSFTSAAGVPVSNIARWNGTSWAGLGAGIGSGNVASLAVYEDNLIAGGYFTTAGSVNAMSIAQWDGKDWSPLGGGFMSGSGVGGVSVLAIHNGELIAGGYFTQAGGAAAGNIAKWNGQDWSSMGAGLDAERESWVFSLLSRDGQLFAGGALQRSGKTPLNNVARWDGERWLPVGGNEIRGEVYTLSELQGELVAGGIFRMDGQHFSNWARFGRSPNELSGDVNCDCVVDFADLTLLLSNFGSQGGTPYAAGDRDGDADVDLQDLAVLLGSYSTTCE
jgi:hypothetical protein